VYHQTPVKRVGGKPMTAEASARIHHLHESASLSHAASSKTSIEVILQHPKPDSLPDDYFNYHKLREN